MKFDTTNISFEKVLSTLLAYAFFIFLFYLFVRIAPFGVETILFSHLIMLFFPIFSLAIIIIDLIESLKGIGLIDH
jgi:magnesium-transporting ATPase (P-type)